MNRQEGELQELAAGAYNAWTIILEKEKQYLAYHGGKYENAPHELQDALNKDRQAYFAEWGSDGKLAALMKSRHEKERERLIEKENIIEQLEKDSETKKDRGHGR